MQINNTAILIQRLAIIATSRFQIKRELAIAVAKKYVNAKYIDVNDPLVNHGNLDPYVIDMLSRYHVLTTRQLKQRLRQFAKLD